MPMNLAAVGASGQPAQHSWTSTDCLLYALGVGAGSVDSTGFELAFTTENSTGVAQLVLPTFVSIVGRGTRSGQRPEDSERGGSSSGGHQVAFEYGTFDPAMLVHGEQSIALHRPIPPQGEVTTTTTVSGIYDKGSGALVVMSSQSLDANDGTPLFSTSSSLFIRGEGGFGGPRGPENNVGPMPEREPDHVVTYETRADQALLYRLSGDRNPLHSDPVFAKRAGFDRPILHGLCTYGFTGRALLHTLCGSDPARFGSMSARFTRPVDPGDSLDVAIWLDEGGARFRTSSDGGQVAIDSGSFRFADAV
jgi:acyl dehydratase